jgi:dCMP deaminase
MPAGWDNNCEDEVWDKTGDYELKTKPEVLHAEANAITKLAKSNDSGLGADIFITHAPCVECAKLIFQSGVSRVWYSSEYRDDSGIRFLKQSGIQVTKVNDETT